MKNTLYEEWITLIGNLDNVYIYGAKEVAYKLFTLLKDINETGRFRGFLVSELKNNPSSIEGYPVIEIKDFTDVDANILMSISIVYHPEAFSLLKNRGFKNVIDAHKFYMLENNSSSEEKISNISDIIDHDILLNEQEKELRDKVFTIIQDNSFSFDEGIPYQSFEKLGIKGIRNTKKRIARYDLGRYISNNSNVLDIGCNYGFLDLTIAEGLNHITAVEYSQDLVKIGKLIADGLGISNIEFISGDYNDFQKNVAKESYDAIFSFAVHVWLNLSPQTYASQIYDMLKSKGYVFFESQTYKTDSKYADFCQAFLDNGFEMCDDFIHCDDEKTERRMMILRKKS